MTKDNNLTKDKNFAQQFRMSVRSELTHTNFVRETIIITAVGLAVWLSGMGPAFAALWTGHRSQIVIACALYLLFRYLYWLPVVIFALVFCAPLVWLKQRRERRGARV